jgi:hypothetical protein
MITSEKSSFMTAIQYGMIMEKVQAERGIPPLRNRCRRASPCFRRRYRQRAARLEICDITKKILFARNSADNIPETYLR